ncbi:PKD domain-containing protein [Autumnicola musiva]|uniref:PKD domain-containing protein n=1 Tax=Autumnicola musiva TaxID=3075589 RepID=A0ABU3D4U0_9FLAO|nr:PKD domain-containing protein [Zunongwangia sp. F117]MDT0676547.1 PKD domain-containing protein [Zunongwangia sp. F117]
MKSLYLNFKFLMILALSAMVFTSCSEDDVEPEPAAVYTFEADELTVTFANNSANAHTYVWDFDDGETSNQIHPTHTYSEGGIYTVELTATGDGGSDVVTHEVTVVAPVPSPTADFTVDADDLTVTFTNTSENAVSYAWDFGDGNTSTEENPTHTYAAEGTYTVVLTTTGEDGTEVESTQEVTVEATEPTAEYTFEVDGLTATFTNTSENAVSYAWDFGDGNTSTEENPTHTYAAEGTYTVILTTTGEDGTEVESTQEVTVEATETGEDPTIYFVTSSNEEEQIEWLESQGFNVIVGSGFNESVINSADLVIIGRSNPSWSINKADYNNLTTPLILNSPWGARSTVLNWFDDDRIDRYTPESLIHALIQEPGDEAFEGVTIGGDDLLPWSTTPADDFLYINTESNGDVLAVTGPGAAEITDGGAVLFVRFDAGEEFYEGAGDSAAGPKTYFGFGGEDGETLHFFPLTEEAKQVYLNEINRLIE